MKKTFVLAALISLSSLCHAQPLAQNYAYSKHGIAYSLAISNWVVDKRGIPSFDYVYEQKGGKDGVCDFQKSGHAVADYEEDGKNVEITVYNAQNDASMNDAEIMSYSDDNGGVTFSSSYDVKKLSDYYTFEYSKTSAAFNKSCLFGDRHLTASFTKPKKR